MLSGKTAVITGCLQGIGRATLDLFAENGANLFACCQCEDERFLTHIEELSQKYQVNIIPIYFDLMDEAAIKQGVRDIQKAKVGVDILVNIAGANIDALFHMVTMDQLRKTFEINFFSQILFTQYITRLMMKQGRGSVINVSSISAIDGNIGQLAYSASKGAIISATKTMAQELGPKGIRVNAVAPGVIQTSMTANLPQEALMRLMKRSNLNRVGMPKEVANVLMYLASEMSSFVTGQVLRIDGGIGG
jgi:3-oxoacyl-[acyl-carrier protein] reductase